MYVFLLRPVRESGGVKGCSGRPDLGPDSGEAEGGKNSTTPAHMHFCSPFRSPAWVSKGTK